MRAVRALVTMIACARAFRPLAARQARHARRALTTMTATTQAAELGDGVRVRFSLTPESGEPIPSEADVFDQGEVKLKLGAGGFLPCLHDKILELGAVGERRSFTVDDAWGPKNADLGPVDVPIERAPPGLKAGDVVRLANGMKARVTAVTEGADFTIDANPALAGARGVLDVELLEVDARGAALETADFALGCFWGAELRFQREPGVVATSVGYTQGERDEPSYEQVCSGTTGHTEGVQVVFDPREVTYERLLEVFWERLGDARYLKDQVGNDRGTQYRHGIYPRGAEQTAAAEASLAAERAAAPEGRTVHTEVCAAKKWWMAEDYHQQYLQKGGQSAKKDAAETIRCYG